MKERSPSSKEDGTGGCTLALYLFLFCRTEELCTCVCVSRLLRRRALSRLAGGPSNASTPDASPSARHGRLLSCCCCCSRLHTHRTHREREKDGGRESCIKLLGSVYVFTIACVYESVYVHACLYVCIGMRASVYVCSHTCRKVTMLPHWHQLLDVGCGSGGGVGSK